MSLRVIEAIFPKKIARLKLSRSSFAGFGGGSMQSMQGERKIAFPIVVFTISLVLIPNIS